jgi:hypothetical protein
MTDEVIEHRKAAANQMIDEMIAGFLFRCLREGVSQKSFTDAIKELKRQKVEIKETLEGLEEFFERAYRLAKGG